MDLGTVSATLRDYVDRSGALSATAVVEEGTVSVAADGESDVDAVGPPLELGVPVRRLPAFDVDALAGEVTSPLGALEHVATGVRALADALGGRSVALAQFPTTDGETAFALSARAGGEEGMLVVIGDEYYEMDPAWPPRSDDHATEGPTS